MPYLPSMPRARHCAAILLSLAGLATLAGCREIAPAFGTPRADGSSPGVVMFQSFADRFTNVTRNPKYDIARMKLAKGALLPSRVFEDTAAWLSRPSESARFINFHGYARPEGYRIDAKPIVPTPARTGDARHTVVLTRLSDDDYRWDVGVDFAVGSLTAEQGAALFNGWYSALERHPPAAVRAASRLAFPRTHAALGRLYSWDSLATRTLADGSTVATVSFTIRPERLRPTLPAFAGFTAKYVGSTNYHLVIADRGGAPWVDIALAKGTTRVQLRVKDGELLPLAGPARPRPDTLQMRLDFLTKVKVFEVGYRELVTDFVVRNTPTEASWSWIATREPKWDLPLAAARLLRAPLRRPFQGAGATFRIGFYETPGGPTLIRREIHLAVQESAVLRFLGNLGASAFGEFEGQADKEQDVFLRDVFGAMAADLRALTPARGGE